MSLYVAPRHLPECLPAVTEGSSLKRLWEPRNASEKVQYIICHCIDCADTDAVEAIFHEFTVLPGYGVSAHYVIETDGSIANLVDPENVAYHAGESEFRTPGGVGIETTADRVDKRLGVRQGQLTLNYVSIGIEFLCPGYAHGGKNWFHFEHYSEKQIEAGLELIRYLLNRFDIPAENVIGHSDVAPFRTVKHTSGIVLGKTDPGPTFFWKALEQHGIGISLPSVALELSKYNASLTAESVREIQIALQRIGYTMVSVSGIMDKSTIYVILAFQQHFVSQRFVDMRYPEPVLIAIETSLDPSHQIAPEIIDMVLDSDTLIALSVVSASVRPGSQGSWVMSPDVFSL